MCTYKTIIFYILVLIVMPFKVITAQDIPTDTAIENELEDKYDSVITKAAFALTSAQYKQAVDYYKEASLLRPEETFPNKMIKYVETIMADVAAKQKRAERAKIREDLTKANQAIIDKSWDSARALFSEILTLNPEKSDAEYAKSKIEAIDLELQRIALRTPPKQEPIIIAPPKNRREARARRKLAERNASLASAASTATTPQQAEAPVPPARNVAAAPPANQMLQKSVTDSLPQNNIATAPLPEKNVVVTPAPKEVQAQRSTEAPLPEKKVTAGVPAARELPQQRSTGTSLPTSNTANTTTAPAIGEVPQKPAPAQTSNNDTAATSSASVIESQKPAETLPKNVTAKEATQQKPAATTPTSNAATEPPKKEVPPKPIQASVPNKNVTAAPIIKEAPQKSTDASLPTREATKEAPTKTIEEPSADKNAVAPLSTETPPQPEGVALKLTDSSNYIKLICQDISFIGTNAYIKVLIQNYSETASFLTDTLQVSIKKNNGIIKKLNQRFISGFPEVMPLKELILVSFADASTGVDPDDVFILEMDDKTKKTKLALQIPWSVYKQRRPF